MIYYLRKVILMITLTFLIVFQGGCSFNQNKLSKKINNLADLNADGKSELIFWNYAVGEPFFETVTFANTNYQTVKIGKTGDIPIFGDFTGDGYFDYGVFQSSDGENKWSIVDGLTQSTLMDQFGLVGDIPVPNDYDGDGKCDFVVYRPSNSGFYGRLSNKGKILESHFGVTGDIPVPKDYDGDGRADIATYRLASGTWLIKSSRNSTTRKVSLGGPEFLHIPADYDGDGHSDPAVWNYTNNECRITFSSILRKKLSDKEISEIQNRLKNTKSFPLSSDFNGDGASELAFWDYNAKTVHIFDLKGFGLKYDSRVLTSKENSLPVNYFLIKKYLHNYIRPVCSSIKRNGLSGLALWKDGKFLCQRCSVENVFDVNVSEPFLADFDWDWELDPAYWSKEKNSFVYFSSNDNKEIIVPFDTANGIPIVGIFNHIDRTNFGVYEPQTSTVYIKNLLKNTDNTEFAEYKMQFPQAAKIFVGDYDGDFVDDFGAFSQNNFTVRLSSTGTEKTISFIVSDNQFVSEDFDGDGRHDLGLIDINNKMFTYLSSGLGKLVNLSLDEKAQGIPFCSDVDMDFKADLIFYNPSTGIFGVAQSSDAYRYDELLFGEKGSLLVNKI